MQKLSINRVFNNLFIRWPSVLTSIFQLESLNLLSKFIFIFSRFLYFDLKLKSYSNFIGTLTRLNKRNFIYNLWLYFISFLICIYSTSQAQDVTTKNLPIIQDYFMAYNTIDFVKDDIRWKREIYPTKHPFLKQQEHNQVGLYIKLKDVKLFFIYFFILAPINGLLKTLNYL